MMIEFVTPAMIVEVAGLLSNTEMRRFCLRCTFTESPDVADMSLSHTGGELAVSYNGAWVMESGPHLVGEKIGKMLKWHKEFSRHAAVQADKLPSSLALERVANCYDRGEPLPEMPAAGSEAADLCAAISAVLVEREDALERLPSLSSYLGQLSFYRAFFVFNSMVETIKYNTSHKISASDMIGAWVAMHEQHHPNELALYRACSGRLDDRAASSQEACKAFLTHHLFVRGDALPLVTVMKLPRSHRLASVMNYAKVAIGKIGTPSVPYELLTEMPDDMWSDVVRGFFSEDYLADAYLSRLMPKYGSEKSLQSNWHDNLRKIASDSLDKVYDDGVRGRPAFDVLVSLFPEAAASWCLRRHDMVAAMPSKVTESIDSEYREVAQFI